MSYNGYKNFETWLFMLYFENDLYEILREKQEYEEEINFTTVYETVEAIIEEISESIDRVEYGYAFVKDLINASLREVNVKEVAETILEQLKEETSHS